MFNNLKSTKTSGPRPRTLSNTITIITAIFIIIIFTAFPLFYDNYYYNIMKAKYFFYYMSAVLMLVVCLISFLVFACKDFKKNRTVEVKSILSGCVPKLLWKRLNVMDKMLLCFLLFAIISTLQSDYVYESFWGNEGRFSGLFLISLYVVSVFLISKFGHIKRWYLDLFVISGMIVCLLGIADYFGMDILDFKVGVSKADGQSFTSTMGNINTYTAFVALIMGVSAGLFSVEKNIYRGICYFIAMLVVFFALITGQSDNAYLALAALFGLMPLVLFKNRTGVKRYVLLITAFVTIMQWIAVINVKMADKVTGLSGLFAVLTKHDNLTYIVIALWVLIAVLYIGDYLICKRKEDSLGKWPRIIWLALLITGMAVILWVLYDANFGGHPERYESLSQYLIFNDSWGTNRGYCWRIGWESYMQQPFHHKFFGFGPDTFGILTWGFREEALSLHGVYYESAHNEYFQYLVTMGPITLFFYLAFLFSACRMMVTGLKEKPWILAPLAAVICYGAQALVNINLPIATPVMWTLLAVGAAACRSTGNGKENARV